MTEPSTPSSPYVVIGGGLAGALIALFLAKRGEDVEIYERRPDLRRADIPAGRSINLALSVRGLTSLAAVGLEEPIRRLCIPMHGRMIHATDGGLTFQPYGKKGQFINSISRRDLNCLLLDEAEKTGRVKLFFQQRCEGFDPETCVTTLTDLPSLTEKKVDGRLILGTDGAFSALRLQMQKTEGFDLEQRYLDYGYKELTIPPKDGDFALDPGALHIWPRHHFMMIALPNQDKSFTCTLFLPFDGPISFAALSDTAAVETFFRTHFADALPLMPTLSSDIFQHPTGSMVTIRCSPYHYKGKILLLGDAAHAVVPFYGQGMNAAFEDCLALDRLLQEHPSPDDLPSVLRSFHLLRKPHSDAISHLALQNFIEMRSKVASRWFLAKKKLESLVHRLFPSSFLPLYTMISFTTIPYADAMKKAQSQDLWLQRLSLALLFALLLGSFALFRFFAS